MAKKHELLQDGTEMKRLGKVAVEGETFDVNIALYLIQTS